MSENISGIVNIIKPAAMSSFFVVSLMKRLPGVKKAGHTGTLDPLATGLLCVCLGRATKIIPYLPEGTKEYIAEIKLGTGTNTLDREGEITARDKNWQNLTEKRLTKTLADFQGSIPQIPPLYSAVHHQGQRLYKLAREGKEVEVESRTVDIFELDILRMNLPYLQLRIVCSSGTYIRSLARDIGEQLGTAAHLSFLVRKSSGSFKLKEAHTLEEIGKMKPENKSEFVIPMDRPLPFSALWVTPRARKKAVNGSQLRKKDLGRQECSLQEGKKFLVYTPEDEFISVSEVRADEDGDLFIQPLRVFFEL